MRKSLPHSFEIRRKHILEARASQHRACLNEPERRLAGVLAGGKLGVYFRRQVVVADRYIADFLAPSIRLVVEVDGRCHERKQAADARRDARLRSLGYHVLRIPAEIVLRDLAAARALVAAEVGKLPHRAGDA